MDYQSIVNSPAFSEVTDVLNEYVIDCNKSGLKISDEERVNLEQIRFLITCLKDPNAKRALADQIWEAVNA